MKEGKKGGRRVDGGEERGKRRVTIEWRRWIAGEEKGDKRRIKNMCRQAVGEGGGRRVEKEGFNKGGRGG